MTWLKLTYTMASGYVFLLAPYRGKKLAVASYYDKDSDAKKHSAIIEELE